MINNVFLYGSLKPGFTLSDQNGIYKGNFPLHAIITKFGLFSDEREVYPFIKPREDTFVSGYVLHNITDYFLSRLDQIENVSEGFYKRVKTKASILNSNDTITELDVYTYVRNVDGIPCGIPVWLWDPYIFKTNDNKLCYKFPSTLTGEINAIERITGINLFGTIKEFVTSHQDIVFENIPEVKK